MECRPLGATGLDVPVVGMGTWRTFDMRGRDAEAQCRAVLDAAYQGGATLFDTSPMYGEAERVLAEMMGARREQAIVADKLWTTDDREATRQAANALRAGTEAASTCIRCTTWCVSTRGSRCCVACATKVRCAHVGAGIAQVHPERRAGELRDPGD